MRSLILSSALFCTVFAAPPVRAAELVTTSETDGGEPDWDVVIVQPLDGDALEGSPDAAVTLIVEFDPYFLGSVQTQVDDEEPVTCELEPCQRELVLAPGQHVIRAWHEWDETSVTVTVNASSETGETEGSDSEGSASEGSDSEGPDPTGQAEETEGSEPTGSESASSGEAPATDTDANETDASDGGESDGSGSSSGDKEGCGCKSAPGLPDLLGLALMALFAPWRRRRHA